MVRIFYEPPPGGPRTHLNRGAYYVESAMEPMWMKRIQKMRPVAVIFPAVAFFMGLCYLPLSKSHLNWMFLSATILLTTFSRISFLLCPIYSEPKGASIYFEP